MKKLLTILLLGIFFISFASAFLGSFERDSTIEVKGNIDASAVNVSIYFPNSSVVVLNQPMTNLYGDIWNYSFSQTSTLGFYYYNYCDENGANCIVNDFEVSPNGKPYDNPQLYSRIFLILLCLGLIFIIQNRTKKINYDSWYSKMTKKYQEKNTFRWVLSALGYNFLKNHYIFSYLAGLLGLLVLTELTTFYNITSVIEIMKIMLGLYTWGALVVVIVFFSQVQEWIVKWKDDIEKINWGLDKE